NVTYCCSEAPDPMAGEGGEQSDNRPRAFPRREGGNPDCAACAFAITKSGFVKQNVITASGRTISAGQPGTATPGLSAARDKAAADQLALDLVGAFPDLRDLGIAQH